MKNAYNLSSRLISIIKISKDEDVMIKTVDDRYMTFNTSLINEKVSRASQGVSVIKTEKGVVDKFEICQLSELEKNSCWYDTLNKAGKKLDL